MNQDSIDQATIMLKIYQWVFPILMGILAFIGGLGVRALVGISKTLTEIKIELAVGSEKHNALENRVEKLEEQKRK